MAAEGEGEEALPATSPLWDLPLLISRPCRERRLRITRYAFRKRVAQVSESVLILDKGTPCAHGTFRG